MVASPDMVMADQLWVSGGVAFVILAKDVGEAVGSWPAARLAS